MLVLIASFVLAALMVTVYVRGRNLDRGKEGRPTIFQELMNSVRKDAKLFPRSLNDIDEMRAEKYALEIVTFIVRFVCRDAAVHELDHPAYGPIRKRFTTIIEDALRTADVIDPVNATPDQQVEVTRVVMHNSIIYNELLKYCLCRRVAICVLRGVLISPRAFSRRVIRHNTQFVPSIAAMAWLRLLEQATTADVS